MPRELTIFLQLKSELYQLLVEAQKSSDRWKPIFYWLKIFYWLRSLWKTRASETLAAFKDCCVRLAKKWTSAVIYHLLCG